MSASGARPDGVVFNMVHLDGKGENNFSDRYTNTILKDDYTDPLVTITYRTSVSKHGTEEAALRETYTQAGYEAESQRGIHPETHILSKLEADNMIVSLQEGLKDSTTKTR